MRANLRLNYEEDRYYIAQATIHPLTKAGEMMAKDVSKAIKLYKIDSETRNPARV